MLDLETNCLLLTEATLNDSAFIFNLLNSPTWLQHIGDRGIKNLKDAETYVQNSLINSYRNHGYGMMKMVLKSNNMTLGMCGLLKRDNLEFPDLGFAILPEFEGNGYTKEAALVILDFAKKADFKTILAFTTEKNLRSQYLLKSIGMKAKGVHKTSAESEEFQLFST